MKVSFAITLVLITGITPRKLNFTRLASQFCEVCQQEPPIHDIHRERLFEVTISTHGNITEKSSIFGLEDQTRGVLLAPNRILSCADYFVDHQEKSYYAYYGYLETLDDEEEFQKQKVTLIYKHSLYVTGHDEYNIAVSEVGEKFKCTIAHLSDECPHFLEKPTREHCNIIGYTPENKARLLNINMHSREECLERYRVLKLNTTLNGNSFCITLQNAVKIPPEVNINEAPIVCKTTVYGLMLLHTHKEIRQNHPIPVYFIGLQSFWIQSKALHLKTVHLISAASFTTHLSLKLLLFSWLQNIYS